VLTFLIDNYGHLLGLAILLCLSAFFSLSETALFNLSRDQLRRFRESRNPFNSLAARLMGDPRRLLVTVLFGNMAVNTAFFAVSVMLIPDLQHRDPSHATLWCYVVTVAAPLIIIVFGEVTPKAVAATIPERLAPLAGLPLTLLGYVATPVWKVLRTAIIAPFDRLVAGPPRPRERGPITTQELRAIVEVAAREGAVSRDESNMLTEVLRLGQVRLREVMVPRVEIVGTDLLMPTRLVLGMFRSSQQTKIIVYEDEIDRIRGAVYAKDAFLNPDKPLAELLRPVHFVPVMKTVENLLKEFRNLKIQFALVVDEYGSLVGLVTLEDCLEAIVGSIEDETDQPAHRPIQPLSETEYLLDGDLSVRAWADEFGQEVPDIGSRYATVAGFLTWILGRVPRRYDSVHWRNMQFIIEEVKSRRVTRVRLRLLHGVRGAEAEAEPKEVDYFIEDEDF
jgi:CBS domain containing-hemolysin-like protein